MLAKNKFFIVFISALFSLIAPSCAVAKTQDQDIDVLTKQVKDATENFRNKKESFLVKVSQLQSSGQQKHESLIQEQREWQEKNRELETKTTVFAMEVKKQKEQIVKALIALYRNVTILGKSTDKIQTLETLEKFYQLISGDGASTLFRLTSAHPRSKPKPPRTPGKPPYATTPSPELAAHRAATAGGATTQRVIKEARISNGIKDINERIKHLHTPQTDLLFASRLPVIEKLFSDIDAILSDSVYTNMMATAAVRGAEIPDIQIKQLCKKVQDINPDNLDPANKDLLRKIKLELNKIKLEMIKLADARDSTIPRRPGMPAARPKEHIGPYRGATSEEPARPKGATVPKYKSPGGPGGHAHLNPAIHRMMPGGMPYESDFELAERTQTEPKIEKPRKKRKPLLGFLKRKNKILTQRDK